MFKVTNLGLDPGHHQTCALLKSYDNNQTKFHILTWEGDAIPLHKHYKTCLKKQCKLDEKTIVYLKTSVF